MNIEETRVGDVNAAEGIKALPRRPARVNPANVMAWLHRRVGIAFNRVEARLFDLRHGTDTAGKVPVRDLQRLVGDNAGRGTGYQSVNEAHFRHVMETLSFPHGSVFVDIGCGKGKPLLLAATYPFIARAIGIEFGGALCAIARDNAIRFGRRHRLLAEILVVHADALCHEIAPDQNIFFMNNPFDADMLAKLVERIVLSTRQRPRAIWILYYNPAHGSVLDSHPGFERQALFRFFGPGRDLGVYRNLA